MPNLLLQITPYLIILLSIMLPRWFKYCYRKSSETELLWVNM